MSQQRKLAWAAPVVVAAVIGGMVLVSARASGEPPLPDLSAQQLVTNVLGAQKTPFSGTVTVTTDIGLPDLSSLGNLFGLQGPSLTSLLAGTTTVQVASDPAVGARAEMDSGTSAYVAVASFAKGEAWTYSSSTNAATRYVLPADSSAPEKSPAADVPTPAATADKLLTSLDASTALSVTATTTVAGRPAYTLTLTPKDGGSLIASVTIAVDASTWLPLAVQVWSTQLAGAPSLSVAFTAVSFATPAASLFAYAAPAGATVKTVDLGQSGQDKPADGADKQPAGATAPTTTVVAGAGWASVVKITGLPADMTAALADPAKLAGMLAGGGTSGPGGTGKGSHHGDAGSAGTISQFLGGMAQQTPQGTVYSTYLGSLLVTPGGDVYAGAVPAAALQAAAG